MIDASRHRETFSPEHFGKRRVDVVGVGATGSHVALTLAKLGVENLHLWDFDKVEGHNLPNQAYEWDDVGKLKVEAMQRLILEATGNDVTIHPQKVDGSQTLGEVVFVLPDTMESRQQIWKKALRLNPQVKRVIETRMGTDSGRIYSVNPLKHVKQYEATFYDDNAPGVAVSECGEVQTLGPTAQIIASLAVWQFIRWFDEEQGRNQMELENEIVICLRPLVLLSNVWK